MKRNLHLVALSSMAFILLGAAAALAQHEQHGQQKPSAPAAKQDGGRAHMQHGSMGVSKMAGGGHDALAKAYMQNIIAFARALKERVESSKSVDAEFARAAVGEMRRSFDIMQQHLAEYKKVMPAETQPMVSTQSSAESQSHEAMGHGAMTQGADQHILEIRQPLEFLEREVHSLSPRADKVSERAAAIIKHVEMMNTSSGAHEDHKL